MAPKEQLEEEVNSKQGEPIHIGDHVYTKIRGGRHEGDVSSCFVFELVTSYL
jgi:hypothetical protein